MLWRTMLFHILKISKIFPIFNSVKDFLPIDIIQCQNQMIWWTILFNLLKISKIFPILNSVKDFLPIDINFNVNIKCYGVPYILLPKKTFDMLTLNYLKELLFRKRCSPRPYNFNMRHWALLPTCVYTYSGNTG